MYYNFEIKEEVIKVAEKAEEELKDIFKEIDKNCFKASEKVLKAFQDNKVSTTDFNEITGYGYYDQRKRKTRKSICTNF